MATRNMEPRKDSESRKADNRPAQMTQANAHLDNRYGRIGIPAVAAAVRCKGDTRKQESKGATRFQRHESD